LLSGNGKPVKIAPVQGGQRCLISQVDAVKFFRQGEDDLVLTGLVP
jgi:hypothetical protein